jgi:heme exporter protein A
VGAGFGAGRETALLVIAAGGLYLSDPLRRPFPQAFMHRITTEVLAKSFGRRVLFRGLSVELAGGQALAVTGPNGSGKSTLLRILAGVLRPSRGSVTLYLDGRALPAEDRPLQTGFVAPYLNVYDGFSARENLAFLARVRRLPGAASRIAEALDRVGLGACAEDDVSTYSSGMKQRVKYAAALLADPPLLLLDEPTTNLDAEGQAMVRRVVRSHREAGRLLVIATNVADEAAGCDRTLALPDYVP